MSTGSNCLVSEASKVKSAIYENWETLSDYTERECIIKIKLKSNFENENIWPKYNQMTFTD